MNIPATYMHDFPIHQMEVSPLCQSRLSGNSQKVKVGAPQRLASGTVADPLRMHCNPKPAIKTQPWGHQTFVNWALRNETALESITLF